MTRTWRVLSFVLLASSTAMAAEKDRKGLDFFESKIRPVLVRQCYKCHSGKAAASKTLKGGLQLDTRTGIRKGGETGPAVVPGQPDKSLLIKALKHEDGLEMPPKSKLPASIIADFEKWIALGAPDPRDGKAVAATEIDIAKGRKHWAFQPLKPVKPPVVKDDGWVRNAVDRFIRARQESADISPNGSADATTLLRRVQFDLVGLPPTLEERKRFLAKAGNDRDAAYGQLVDRLLESQHFGERWARHWLDLVRFAESNGYAFDKDRPNAFQYRDFVIRAFNADMPYDRFVRLQLAGDLLTDLNVQTNAAVRPTTDAIAATGFLVAGPFTTQQTQKERERSRYEQLDDMVHTLGTSLLGLTMGCARCHSHKYDPLPQNDYYRLVSCFKEVGFADTGINMQPEEFRATKAVFDKAHASVVKPLADFERDQLPKRFEDWLTNRPARPVPPKLGDWHHVGPFPAGNLDEAFNKTFGPEGKVDLSQKFLKDKLKWTKQPSWVDGKVHNTLSGNNSANYLYRVVESAEPQVLALSLGSDDAIKVFVNGKQVLAKKVSRGAAADQEKVQVGLVKGRTELLLKIVNGGGASGFYFKSTGGSPPKEIAALLKAEPAKWNDKQRKQVGEWYRTLDDKWVGLNNAVENHKKTEPKPKLTQVYAAKVKGTTYQFGDDTYKVYFLARGNADNKQGLALPGFLQVLATSQQAELKWLKPGKGKDPQPARIALADWLTDVEHGAGQLLARVIVNRLWHYHFGRGLVASTSDFGTRGELPTHPKLLDWLAVELIQGGWKLKPIHRLILSSATYMQAGDVSKVSQQRDPENRLWWRRPARRLEAEIIRDSLLAVSGTLDRKTFGKGTLDQKSPRRSIYLTVKRGQLIPILQLFDAPDAMQGVGRRSESTVAPQALAMLNSPFIRELAGKLAGRVRPDERAPLTETVTQAYRTVLARDASSEERDRMGAFIKSQTVSRNGQPDARALAVRDFCHLLLCTNEFIYVD